MPYAGLAGLSYAYARTLQPEKALEMKDLILSVAQDMPAYCPHYDLGVAHLGAQEYPAMFEHLRQAYETRMPELIFLETNPLWDEIRRFNEYRQLSSKIFGSGQRPPL